jgi:hypothetical protein
LLLDVQELLRDSGEFNFHGAANADAQVHIADLSEIAGKPRERVRNILEEIEADGDARGSRRHDFGVRRLQWAILSDDCVQRKQKCCG